MLSGADRKPKTDGVFFLSRAAALLTVQRDRAGLKGSIPGEISEADYMAGEQRPEPHFGLGFELQEKSELTEQSYAPLNRPHGASSTKLYPHRSGGLAQAGP